MITRSIILGLIAVLWAGSTLAIGRLVTIQGTLDDAGVPANGSYDLIFQLKSNLGSNVSLPITLEDRTVSQGVFTVQVDFGAGVFSSGDRVIAVSVRPGASSGAYTALSPDIPEQPAPYAQLASNSELADDVIDFAIDEIDIATGAVSARNIASGAVGVDEIATAAVGNLELANEAVSLSKLRGANYTSPTNFNATILANSCGQVDISVTGGFTAGDFVIGMTNSTFPSNVILQTGVVVSTNVVRMRFCNVGNSTQNMVNEQIRLISLR